MMGRNQDSRQVPGSRVEKLWTYFWNAIILGTWIGLIALWQEIFCSMKKYDYNELPKCSGQTVVLTGGARGIGLQVLKKLLQLDYNVIFGVRNIDAGLKAVNDIRLEGVKTGTAKCLRLDLKSLKSVRQFAQNVLNETTRIDVLINNAGIMIEPYNLTEDGYEAQFQVNHLSHFLLTTMLLAKIKTTAAGKNTNCRVVNVSSAAHLGSIPENFKDIQNPKIYSAHRAYFDSKMSQVLFTKYLDAQLKAGNANVNIYALHPGVIVTDLYANLPSLVQLVFNYMKGFFRSTDTGSEVVMYAAISPELEGDGGHYIVNKEKSWCNYAADDLTLQNFLWNLSEKCVSGKS